LGKIPVFGILERDYIKEPEFRYNNRDNLEEFLYKVLGGIY
jgi:hypothetical protein